MLDSQLNPSDYFTPHHTQEDDDSLDSQQASIYSEYEDGEITLQQMLNKLNRIKERTY